jgi:hypothetical protein
MKKALAVALCVGLTACAPGAVRSPILVPIAYDASAHTSYQGSGSGSIKGQAFLRQKGGGVVTCAGSPVIVVPATPYFRSVLDTARSGRTISNVDPAAKSLAKKGMCDAQGNFMVSGLQPGKWLVTTGVEWSVGYEQQGGGLLKEVDVSSDKETSVLLTDADFYAR